MLCDMFKQAEKHAAELPVTIVEELKSLHVPSLASLHDEIKDWGEEKLAEFRQKVRGIDN